MLTDKEYKDKLEAYSPAMYSHVTFISEVAALAVVLKEIDVTYEGAGVKIAIKAVGR